MSQANGHSAFLSVKRKHLLVKAPAGSDYLALQHRAFLWIFDLNPSVVWASKVFLGLNIPSDQLLLLLRAIWTFALCLGSCPRTWIRLCLPSITHASKLLCQHQCYLCPRVVYLSSISSCLAEVCVLLFSSSPPSPASQIDHSTSLLHSSISTPKPLASSQKHPVTPSYHSQVACSVVHLCALPRLV